ncbi:MAG: Rieske 2Fe-2S domain-containing protein [Deltaproteobacteria bacterium]|nr:Rieske 2Fe-2S domain-containing protein [Deltaproteobacteria bacterium]
MKLPVNHDTSLPLPNGWFCVAWSKDLVPGEVKRVYYFGEELVVYRTRRGKAVVLNAYCAHLGAHLGQGGRVLGDNLRCPFHGWEFGPSGRCETIPYCDTIPPRARVRSWDVREVNRMILVWRHAEGEPPSWEPPELPEIGGEGWTEPIVHEVTVGVHMQDMAENNMDPQHFLYVHHGPPEEDAEISYGEGGRFLRVRTRHAHETPYGRFTVDLERDTWGLGLTSVRMMGFGEKGLLMYTSTSPIDEHRCISRWLITTGEDLADTVGAEFLPWAIEGVKQDFPIWENKIHRPDPVLCKADRELIEFRKWVRQFYSHPLTQADADPREARAERLVHEPVVAHDLETVEAEGHA